MPAGPCLSLWPAGSYTTADARVACSRVHLCTPSKVCSKLYTQDECNRPIYSAASAASSAHAQATRAWRTASGSAAAVIAAVTLAWCATAAATADLVLDSKAPVLDLARIVPDEREAKLAADLTDLERRTGWRLRLLTRNGPKQGPTGEEIRRAWAYDRRTAVVICDPTSPNILQFQAGDEVIQLLRRGFFIELQSRFGNMFFVPVQGEDAAVLGALGAMGTCLERGGCAVVPGLPRNQYELTLLTSLLGGCVFGYSTTLPTQGFVRRKFVWPLLFAPLWGILFVSFGIGPIVTRTEERLPLLQNFAAFLGAAAVFNLSPLFSPGAVDLDLISKEGQKKQDEKDLRDE